MNKFQRVLIWGLSCFLVAGCATMTLIKEKNSKWKNAQFEAILPIGWVKYTSPGATLALTKDGMFLQNISILKSKTNKELPNTKRKITEDLLVHEIASIVVDEIKLTEGVLNFNLLSKKPMNISGKEAFRLDFEFTNSENVKYYTVIYGFVHKRKFYEIEYRGMSQHYHDESFNVFEEFIKEFKIREK